MKKVLLLLLIVSITTGTFAQKNKKDKENQEEVSDNLVPNYDFEEVDAKLLKKPGFLDELCDDWVSGSRELADVFSAFAKQDKVAVPGNIYGTQEAYSGDSYAGIRAYSKDDKLSRTYITVELTDAMEANQQYCVRFNVSLADLSKYSVNGIGMYISNKKIVQPNTNDMIKDAQIMHKTNKVMSDMEGWETICATFTATGKEKYIIIGNFMIDEKIKIEKVKKPRDVVGTQHYHAYYYVDQVEIVPIDAKSQCASSDSDKNEPEIVYSRGIVYTEDMSVEDKIAQHSVYFANLSSETNSISKRDLDKLVVLLNENPSVQINIIGHSTNDEMDEARINTRFKDLGIHRARQVANYLESKGISSSRFEVSSLEDTDPANTRTTPMSIAQNRRVVISVK